VSQGFPSGTVTFLFTDIEGSTRLLKEIGRDRYEEALAEQQRILRAAFTAHQGQVVDTQGDSFFVAFRTAADAAAAAVDAQRGLAAHSWPEDTEVNVGSGTEIHAERTVLLPRSISCLRLFSLADAREARQR
jgi:class 3 adenylate cyclase